MTAPHTAYEKVHERALGSARGAIDFNEEVVPLLVDGWLARYRTAEPNAEVIRTETKGHAYLFDVPNTRLLAAWTVIAAREKKPRDAGRMKGAPQSYGEAYHRGHAIGHTMGGGEDINLVPQLGVMNVGRFRKLERQALKTEGALYFTFWIYAAPDDQLPIWVEQGLLTPGRGLAITVHENRTAKS